eukprot:8027445-Alexandrium_andersonii.AAC.1
MVKSWLAKNLSQGRRLRSGFAWDGVLVLQAQGGLLERLRTWRGGGYKCVVGSQQQSVGGYQRSATMK